MSVTNVFYDIITGSGPILSAKGTITINTMLNSDGEFDGHEDGDVTCKQNISYLIVLNFFFFSKKK